MLQNKIPWKLYEFAQAIVDGLRAHSLPWVSSKLRMYVCVSQPAAGLQDRISWYELHRIIGSGRKCRVRGDIALCRIAIKYAQSHICRRVRFDMSWQPGTHPQHAVSSTVLDTFNTTTQQARQAWQQALQEPTEHQQSARLQCSAVSSTAHNTYTQPSDLTAKSRPTAPKYLPTPS